MSDPAVSGLVGGAWSAGGGLLSATLVTVPLTGVGGYPGTCTCTVGGLVSGGAVVWVGVDTLETGGRTTEICCCCWGTPGRMPAAGGPRTNVVPGGSVRVVPPRGSAIGGGPRIMRT